MKNTLSTLACLALLTVGAYAAEPPKPKVATVNLNTLLHGGHVGPRLALLSLDADTLAALRKLASDVKATQRQIVDATDQAQLNDLQNKLQFLQRKYSLLAQKPRGDLRRIDQPALLREFLLTTYKNEYQLIFLSEACEPNVMLWSGGVELTDITEEAAAKLQEYLNSLSAGAIDAPDPFRSVMPPPAIKPTAR